MYRTQGYPVDLEARRRGRAKRRRRLVRLRALAARLLPA